MWVLRSVELLPNVGCREGGRIVQTSTHPHALTLSPLLRVYPSLQLPADEVKQLVVSMGGRGCSTMYSTSGRWIEGLSLLARHELIAIRLPAPLFVPQEHQLRSQPTYAPWHRGMAGKRAGLRPSTGNGQDQVRGGRNRGRVGSAAYPSPPPGWAASAAVAACPSPPPPCAPGVCVGGGGGGGVWVGGGGRHVGPSRRRHSKMPPVARVMPCHSCAPAPAAVTCAGQLRHRRVRAARLSQQPLATPHTAAVSAAHPISPRADPLIIYAYRSVPS